MKHIKIIYWTSTLLFAAFMAFSGYVDLMVTPDAVMVMKDYLGYPVYIIPFIGLAKLLGSIAIVVPRFSRLKEWAYAGFAIDLLGAAYSNIAVAGWDPGLLFIFLLMVVFTVSYIFNLKYKRRENTSHSPAFA